MPPGYAGDYQRVLLVASARSDSLSVWCGAADDGVAVIQRQTCAPQVARPRLFSSLLQPMNEISLKRGHEWVASEAWFTPA